MPGTKNCKFGSDNFASRFRRIGFTGAYSASKHAMKAFSDTLRLDFAASKTKIFVSEVCPGGVLTGLPVAARAHEDAIWAAAPKEAHERYPVASQFFNGMNESAASQLLTPADVANKVVEGLVSKRPQER
jgi:NAD(P)-dependent dehydrogenase (short-subunit alcohol dehydrogenase family)